MKRFRLIVETDADEFSDVDSLLITIEAALDAVRRHGETAAVWLEGEVGPHSTGLTTEPVPIDPEYIQQRHLEEDPWYYVR